MASGGLLSLKWNNHKTTFFHVLSTIRSKEAYCDATIACDGRFYPVHKLVMSTCSDYFEEMFERTSCKHPVIVLKDIRHEDLEALLNYMYVGEVNVLQNELAGLIKAAECLMIKGLAVPDEAPSKDSPRESKRGATKEESPQAKRRRRDDSDSGRYDSASSNNIRSSSQNQTHRDSSSSSSRQQESTRHSSSASGQSSSFRRRDSSPPPRTSDSLPDDPGPSQNSNQDDFKTNSEKSRSQDMPSSQSQNKVPEVVLDEPPGVKDEPEEIQEVEEVQEDTKNVLDSSFSYDHMSEGDSMSNIEDGSHGAHFDAQMMSGAPQSMEDLVAQAMPGSSGMQGNSLWESEGSLQGFPPEFGDAQRGPNMVSPIGYLSSSKSDNPHSSGTDSIFGPQVSTRNISSNSASVKSSLLDSDLDYKTKNTHEIMVKDEPLVNFNFLVESNKAELRDPLETSAIITNTAGDLGSTNSGQNSFNQDTSYAFRVEPSISSEVCKVNIGSAHRITRSGAKTTKHIGNFDSRLNRKCKLPLLAPRPTPSLCAIQQSTVVSTFNPSVINTPSYQTLIAPRPTRPSFAVNQSSVSNQSVIPAQSFQPSIAPRPTLPSCAVNHPPVSIPSVIPAQSFQPSIATIGQPSVPVSLAATSPILTPVSLSSMSSGTSASSFSSLSSQFSCTGPAQVQNTSQIMPSLNPILQQANPMIVGSERMMNPQTVVSSIQSVQQRRYVPIMPRPNLQPNEYTDSGVASYVVYGSHNQPP